MQKDERLSLDLSGFACDEIQVSFSAVGPQSQSQFSPVQTLCVDGGKTVFCVYSETSLIWTPMEQKTVSFIERCPYFRYARVVVGVGKGVLYREVSSVQGCPYRGVPLYISVLLLVVGSVEICYSVSFQVC